MARKKRNRPRSGWEVNIPDFSVNNRFTYFLSLMPGDDYYYYNEPAVEAKKSALVNGFYQNSAAMDFKQDQGLKNFHNALSFLNEVARSERAKELRILFRYKDKLIKQANAINNQHLLDFIKNNLNETMLEHPEDFHQFSFEITELINLARKNYEEALTDVHRIQAEAAKENARFTDFLKLDHMYSLPDTVRQAMNVMMGISGHRAFRRGNPDADNLSGTIREQVFNYFGDHLNRIISTIGSSPQRLMSSIVAMTMEATRYVNTELQKRKMTSTDNIIQKGELNKEIRSIMQNYMKEQDSTRARMIQALESNDRTIYTTLDSITKLLHIDTIKDPGIRANRAQKLQSDIQKTYDRMQKQMETQDEKAFMRMLKALPTNNGQPNDFFFLTYKIENNSQTRGLLNEIFQALRLAGEMQPSRMIGIDLLGVQWLINEKTDAADNSHVTAYTKVLEKEISQLADRQGTTLKQLDEQRIRAVNTELKNTEAAILKRLQQIVDPNIEELFIYHESLKLSSRTVSGINQAKGHETQFHGRSLKMVTYINEMYAMNNLGGFSLPHKPVIEMIANNIMDGALGYSLAGPLEKYFSLFAGMIMFDDVTNIAEDVAGGLYKEGLYNIHLYNLNGVYVPASVILEQVAHSMTNFEVHARTAAEVEIEGLDKASGIIKNFLQNQHGMAKADKMNYLGNWAPIGERVLNSMTVSIYFFAGFVDFINNMFSTT